AAKAAEVGGGTGKSVKRRVAESFSGVWFGGDVHARGSRTTGRYCDGTVRPATHRHQRRNRCCEIPNQDLRLAHESQCYVAETLRDTHGKGFDKQTFVCIILG